MRILILRCPINIESFKPIFFVQKLSGVKLVEKQTIIVKTEDEMFPQIKILLNNGYVVAVCKDDNMTLPDTNEYTIAYTKKEQ